MYKCGICSKQVGPRIPSTTIVVETRPKTYDPRPNVGDPGGFGFEIVREVKACSDCAEDNN